MSGKEYSPGWFVGGYLDDSISDDRTAMVRHTLNDLGEEATNRFLVWLRRELADYRNLKEISENLPGAAQGQESAKRIEATISTLLCDLERMSPNLASRVDADLLRQGHDAHEVARRSLICGVMGKLTELQFSLLRVESELRALKPGRGRKKNTIRDSFLARVNSELLAVGFPKTKAATIASEILTACGVEVPADGRPRPEKRIGKN